MTFLCPLVYSSIISTAVVPQYSWTGKSWTGRLVVVVVQWQYDLAVSMQYLYISMVTTLFTSSHSLTRQCWCAVNISERHHVLSHQSPREGLRRLHPCPLPGPGHSPVLSDALVPPLRTGKILRKQIWLWFIFCCDCRLWGNEDWECDWYLNIILQYKLALSPPS